ncbi:tetratricopeptide repeat protein [Ketobacter sp.]|uniref:tetratricopeptide repeat protein n=1 Tax=Ketobacter sp. TaxID=2083498 RepID=UPI000F235D8D|nr:tetratricopeptide repeat protein [Ketobacter sp.]RLT97958.1 MAG: tetratricopeptide repeat protein [Ketobacter sp.]
MGKLMRRVLLLALMVGALLGCAGNPTSMSGASSIKMSPTQQLMQQLKVHYDQGEMLYKSGQLEQARKEFESMLQLKPDEPNANYRLGTIAFRLREFDESAAYFTAVIQVDPKHLKAHYNLASIRLMQAENHFKYYAALVEPDTDLAKVSKLIADIDRFNSKRLPNGNEQNLDQLATSLKK